MNYDREKLEEWVLRIPECGGFLFGFFESANVSLLDGLVNYVGDIRSYSQTDSGIRRNSCELLDAFKDITGMRIYFDDYLGYQQLSVYAPIPSIISSSGDWI